MKRLILQDNVLHAIDTYIENYTNYFYNLYTDTWIFSEDMILALYKDEALLRKGELENLISTKFSPDIIQGRTLDNTLHISWRSKILFIAWEDIWNKRIITRLIIK